MDYTYQPEGTARSSGLSRFLQSFKAGTDKSRHSKSAAIGVTVGRFGSGRSDPLSLSMRRPRSGSEAPVKEIVLGKSPLARLGYWLLMRSARATNPSHNWCGGGKKSKVTRSELRQNRIAEDLLSIVAANGKRRVVRISESVAKPLNSASTGDNSGSGGLKPNDVPAAEAASSKMKQVQLKQVQLQQGRGKAGSRQVTQHGKATVKRNPDHRLKKYEQDLFVKTERNIAAAMKEAQKGISAEQLVVKFGLSVPEAGLIASKCK